MYFTSQLPFLDTIWWSEWYLTNGRGHNQINIPYKIFSHIQQILSCGIFNFCIPRMLEAFRRVSELQLPFLGAKRSSDLVLYNKYKWKWAQTLICFQGGSPWIWGSFLVESGYATLFGVDGGSAKGHLISNSKYTKQQQQQQPSLPPPQIVALLFRCGQTGPLSRHQLPTASFKHHSISYCQNYHPQKQCADVAPCKLEQMSQTVTIPIHSLPIFSLSIVYLNLIHPLSSTLYLHFTWHLLVCIHMHMTDVHVLHQ